MNNRIAHSLLSVAFALALTTSVAPSANAKKPKPFPTPASIDRSFGGTGRVPLPGLVKFPSGELGVKCACTRGGGVYALVKHDGLTSQGTSELKVFARTASGRRVRKFGRKGMVSFPRFKGTLIKAVSASDGSLFLVAGAENDFENLAVTKLLSTGAIDKRWGVRGTVDHSAISGTFVDVDVAPDGEISIWTRDKDLHSFITRIDANGDVDGAFAGGQLRIERSEIDPYQSYGKIDVRSDGAVLLSSTAPDGNKKMARVLAFSSTGVAMPEFSWHGNIDSVPSDIRAQLPNSVKHQNIHRASASWLKSGGIGVVVRAYDEPIAFAWSFRIGSFAPYGTNGFALVQRAGLSLSEQQSSTFTTAQQVRADGRVTSFPTDDYPTSILSLDSRGTATTGTQRMTGFAMTSLVDAGSGREFLCGYWGKKEQIVKLRFNRFPYRFGSG